METAILAVVLVAALAYLLRKATAAGKAFQKSGGCKSCGCGEKDKPAGETRR